MPLELPAQESASLIEGLAQLLVGGTRNDKRAKAYAIIAAAERLVSEGREDWDAPELEAELVDVLVEDHGNNFAGRTTKARKESLHNAAAMVAQAVAGALHPPDPDGLCSFAEFKQRYGLEGKEIVPFNSGIKIITGEEKSGHLQRAKDKFAALAELIEKALPPMEDRVLIDRARSQLYDKPKRTDREQALVDGRLFNRDWPTHYPADNREFYLTTTDVWTLWCTATQKKIRRPHKK